MVADSGDDVTRGKVTEASATAVAEAREVHAVASIPESRNVVNANRNMLLRFTFRGAPNGLEMSRPASSRILLDRPLPQLAGSAPSSC